MKKLIYGSVFLLSIGVGVLSCKKEAIHVNESKKELHVDNVNLKSSSLYRVSNNILILNSVEDFEQLVQLSNEDINLTLRNLNYVSYEEFIGPEGLNLIEDDFLSAALNKDQAIQIGDYIYRINKAEEEVYALPVEKREFYSDLISENTSNGFVLNFSSDDDVFYLLDSSEELITKKSGLKCSKSNADGDGNKKYSDWVDEAGYWKHPGRHYKFHYNGKVRYDSWGIYKKLFTEFKHWETLFGIENTTYFTINYDFNYLVKNGNSGSANYIFPADYINSIDNVGTTYSNGPFTYPLYAYFDKKKEIVHYKGTKCLSNFNLSANIWFRNKETRKPNRAYNRTLSIQHQY